MALATIKATIPLTIISFAIGLVIALVVALMRLSSITILSQLAAFVSLIRGTPLLLAGVTGVGGDLDVGVAVVLKYFSAARLSLTVASTRCCLTRVTAWVKASTSRPLRRHSLPPEPSCWSRSGPWSCLAGRTAE